MVSMSPCYPSPFLLPKVYISKQKNIHFNKFDYKGFFLDNGLQRNYVCDPLSFVKIGSCINYMTKRLDPKRQSVCSGGSNDDRLT